MFRVQGVRFRIEGLGLRVSQIRGTSSRGPHEKGCSSGGSILGPPT